MFKTEKQKRESPPRLHLLRYMLIVAIGGVLLVPVIAMLLNRMDKPYRSSFSLVAFDIAEERDEIALSWSDGQTSLLVTQRWSEFQMGQFTSRHVVDALRDTMIIRVDAHPQQDSLISVSRDTLNPVTLYHGDQPAAPFASRVEDAFYSSTGQWMVVIDPSSISMRAVNQEAAPARFSYSRVYQSNAVKVVTSVDDTLIAVAEQRSPDSPWGIRVLQTADNAQIASVLDSLPNVAGMAFHPDGKRLAVTTDVAVFLFDLEKGTLHRLPLSTNYVPLGQIAYDPTGRWLIGSAGANHQHLPRALVLFIYDFATDPDWPDPAIAGVGTDSFTFQIVGERIIIGRADNQIYVIRRNGDTWVRTSEWAAAPQ